MPLDIIVIVAGTTTQAELSVFSVVFLLLAPLLGGLFLEIGLDVGVVLHGEADLRVGVGYLPVVGH